MSAPWTICPSCFAAVDVVVYPAEGADAEWWTADCSACDITIHPPGMVAGQTTDTTPFPPPTALDNLAQILPILARVSDDESASAEIRGHALDIVAAVLAAQKAVSHDG